MSLRVPAGPLLLRPVEPGLAGHRAAWPTPPALGLADLVGLTEAGGLHGRGGAAFPLARKLAALPRHGRRPVVVNLAEGEPRSHKDEALAVHRPHLVLDGAQIAAAAVGARSVHLIVPAARPHVADALARAAAERSGGPRWVPHTAADRFVSGEASAVTELVDGRPGLPVTSWVPTAMAGVKGRPTLLSNAETYAQLAALVADPAAYAGVGTPDEPGTRLLTVHGAGGRRVLEVAHGTPWSEVLVADELADALLVGGFHGRWLRSGVLADQRLGVAELAACGASFGAGVMVSAGGRCPVWLTAAIAGYLARESAGRCGPCRNGLPALADTLAALDAGTGGAGALDRVRQLCGLVEGRGACAHPDGTSRLVRSLLTAFADEVEAHTDGVCAHAGTLAGRSR